jgi:SlyX protein
MNEERFIELEIKIAYQDDLLQALNDIVAQQQQQIDRIVCSHKIISEQLNRLLLKETPAQSMLPEHDIPPHY